MPVSQPVPTYLLTPTPSSELGGGEITNKQLLQWGLENYYNLQQCNADKRAVKTFINADPGLGAGAGAGAGAEDGLGTAQNDRQHDKRS